MKKRQMKKNHKKIEDKLEEFEASVEFLANLGVYAISQSFEGQIECQINAKDFLKLPFIKRDELVIKDDTSDYYPYSVTFKKGKLDFLCLQNRESFIRNFPEYAEITEDYIVVNGVRYLKKVQ